MLDTAQNAPTYQTAKERAVATEDTPPGPDGPTGEDERVAVEVGRGVEWLCEPGMVGWRTAASGYGWLLDHAAQPV